MSLPRNPPDPRHRYQAMVAATRAAGTAREEALEYLIHGGAVAPSIDPAILQGVTAAYTSFLDEDVRTMLDACVLGKATGEDLLDAFAVSVEESSAYAELFFDTQIFPNDIHTIAWIKRLPDAKTQALMKEAHTKGFRALRFRWAAERAAPSVETMLSRVLEADTRQYVEMHHMPLNDQRIKELRHLGKQVLAGAGVLHKVGEIGSAADNSDTPEFVVEHRPANPTLEELAARGVKIVQ